MQVYTCCVLVTLLGAEALALHSPVANPGIKRDSPPEPSEKPTQGSNVSQTPTQGSNVFQTPTQDSALNSTTQGSNVSRQPQQNSVILPLPSLISSRQPPLNIDIAMAGFALVVSIAFAAVVCGRRHGRDCRINCTKGRATRVNHVRIKMENPLLDPDSAEPEERNMEEEAALEVV
ncbi:uncharacterized protein LOC135807027 [Sycon ciliatum]|uniref:uncharacterized protein LOC135807027 n=1 Tax=Sycon ciliatum TaxID=27933 RepID=UPI0031F6A324